MKSKYRAGILLCPAIVLILATIGYPLVYACYSSLTDKNLAHNQPSHWVGLNNFFTVITDHFWWKACIFTVIVTIITVSCECVLALIIALVMRSTIVLSHVVRVCVLLPYSIITAVSAYSWLYAWTPHIGYMSHVFIHDNAPLTHRTSAMLIICLAEIWKTTPFLSLIFLSGLMNIPEDIITAAKIDGAHAGQRLFMIILPAMKSTIIVGVFFRIVDSLRIFDNIYILTAGTNSTYSIAMLGYDNLFQTFNLGLGSAISIVIVLNVVALLGIVILICRLFRVNIGSSMMLHSAGSS